jgi:hypothetical protein
VSGVGVVACLCKRMAPLRAGGSAAARLYNGSALHSRMHSKPHQPPTTPCLYLANPARCTSHFVVVWAVPSAKISALRAPKTELRP